MGRGGSVIGGGISGLGGGWGGVPGGVGGVGTWAWLMVRFAMPGGWNPRRGGSPPEVPRVFI
jgi:hypothetical protein